MLNHISRCCAAAALPPPGTGEQMPRQRGALPSRARGPSLGQELLTQKYTFLETQCLEVEKPEMKCKGSSQQTPSEPRCGEQRDAQGQALGPRRAGTTGHWCSPTGLGCVTALQRVSVPGGTVSCWTLSLALWVLPRRLLGRAQVAAVTRGLPACQHHEAPSIAGVF